MMTRIYGITFPGRCWMSILFCLKKPRSKHHQIGKEMDLVQCSLDTVGGGICRCGFQRYCNCIRLQDFLRRIQARYDYQEVMCPPIGNKLLYITSGHYAKYGKDSFQPIHTPEEGEEYFLKPTNRPHHCMTANSPVLTKTCLCVWQSSVRFAVTSRVASCTV